MQVKFIKVGTLTGTVQEISKYFLFQFQNPTVIQQKQLLQMVYKRMVALRLNHNISDSNRETINELLWKTTVLKNKTFEMAKTVNGREKLKSEINTIIKRLKMLESSKDQLNLETTTYNESAMDLARAKLVC